MDTNVAQPKPRRRWYQYSLRTLLIFVTLAGCVFGWLGKKVWEAREQQAAVALIEKKGCVVTYDYQLDSKGTFMLDAVLPGPAWLHALLGDDCFRNVRAIQFDTITFNIEPKPKITDADLGRIKVLTKLEQLCLDDTQVTDAGLECLQSMTHLKEFRLTRTKVTDAGLEHLKRLTQLEWLDLENTQVTDAGLEHLTALTQLGQLMLEGTQVSDAGIAKLHKALPNCRIDR